MAKKLLSEAIVRRFAKLAMIPAINESYHNPAEEPVEETVRAQKGRNEAHFTNRDTVGRGLHEQEEELPGEEPMGLEGGEDLEGEMDLPGEEPEMGEVEPEITITQVEADALRNVLDQLLDVASVEGEEMPGEEPMEEPMGELPPEMPPEEEEEEPELMEALSEINYVPGKKEIVEEVARRVAKRLLKAKRAEKELQEALGKPDRVPARRRRPRRLKK